MNTARWMKALAALSLFAVGTAVNLAAFAVMHWWVREPRHTASAQVEPSPSLH